MRKNHLRRTIWEGIEEISQNLPKKKVIELRKIAARRAAKNFGKIEGIEEIFQRERREGIEEAQKKKL